MRASDLMVGCLAAQGADRIFCVPGESYLALLDALHGDARIDVVVCRHEGGAGFAAVADAKLTGRPGVVACSRGPGATNAAIAAHLAEQDAVPLVMLVGQVARHERGRGAFQEVDYGQMFGRIAKGVWEVNDADRLPEIVARAWATAQGGTPGPVVIALPEDMLSDSSEAAIVGKLPVPRAAPASAEIDRAMALLERAERPLLIAGGQVAGEAGRAALARVAAAHHLAVATTFKYQHVFDNASPLFAGHLGFHIPTPQVEALSGADLILAVGTRLGDTPTQGYKLPRAPEPAQPLIHVYPDAAAIGRTWRTDLGLPCDPVAFLEALAARNAEVPPARRAWAEEANGWARRMRTYAVREFGDGLDFGAVIEPMARRAPRDAIMTMDAGNFSSWAHATWPWDGTQQMVGAVGGAMGIGVPGALAACLRHPDRTVICMVGDGGLMMNGNELATAIARGCKPRIVVSNNGSYGTIRLHQEGAFPGRVSGTRLANPDFAAWGRAFGALGLTVREPGEAEEAVEQFLTHDGPVVMDVHSSVEGISALTTLSRVRG
ncbi:MAG TPA: thiamine pyrophosphate-dependent enzyme [Paracoccaceae bacterium]|nr:thiamine pyrophosphate-dependent enzyme [Paracoccaceae bacterium]